MESRKEKETIITMKKQLMKTVLVILLMILPALSRAQKGTFTSYYKVNYGLYGSKFQTLDFGLSVDYHLHNLQTEKLRN